MRLRPHTRSPSDSDETRSDRADKPKRHRENQDDEAETLASASHRSTHLPSPARTACQSFESAIPGTERPPQSCIPVRSLIYRIDGIGVREVRRLLLERHGNEPGEMLARPGLIELVAALQTAHAQLLFGRRRPGLGVELKRHGVPHSIDGWVVSIWMFVISLGQQNRGMDVDWISPERRQLIAVNKHMLYKLSIGISFRRRNNLIDLNLKRSARAEMNFLNAAV